MIYIIAIICLIGNFMKIISWNVNGVRAALKKDLLGFIKNEKPDLLCLQEIKISASVLEKEGIFFPGYKTFWQPAKRPGYSGTATLIKEHIVEAGEVTGDIKGLGDDVFDDEGRVQIIELSGLYLFNCYYPNANPALTRLDYKRAFNKALLKKAKQFEKHKPVIVCGDLNVAHREIDLARPKENVKSPGFTPQEREDMDKFLNSGFIDTFREINGDKIKYSWWSYRSFARERNVGWRIDYFCVSDKLKKSIKGADILDQVYGSDHAPVILELKR